MSARLTSRMLVGALVRRAQAAGGFATILHKGESASGSIVVQIAERGESRGFLERITNLSGTVELVPCGPGNSAEFTENSQYIERRVGVDPDIWFVELDVAGGEQLAAEILCAG